MITRILRLARIHRSARHLYGALGLQPHSSFCRECQNRQREAIFLASLLAAVLAAVALIILRRARS